VSRVRGHGLQNAGGELDAAVLSHRPAAEHLLR